jgi:hypothetical protein
MWPKHTILLFFLFILFISIKRKIIRRSILTLIELKKKRPFFRLKNIPMDDLYECIRIMQISTEKLQSSRYFESLHRTSLIRSTFIQSRKHFCDLLYSFIKISSQTNTLLPVIIQNENFKTFLPYETSINQSSQKRKSSHVDTVKRLRITSS